MIVRNPITHGVVGTDDVQKRGEEWECMSEEEKMFSRRQQQEPKGTALERDRHFSPQEPGAMKKQSFSLTCDSSP